MDRGKQLRITVEALAQIQDFDTDIIEAAIEVLQKEIERRKEHRKEQK